MQQPLFSEDVSALRQKALAAISQLATKPIANTQELTYRSEELVFALDDLKQDLEVGNEVPIWRVIDLLDDAIDIYRAIKVSETGGRLGSNESQPL